MKPLPPKTKTAMLPSAGYGQLTATRHVYVETRECISPGPDGLAYEHIFRCEETGEERRWGLDCELDIAEVN